MPFGFRRATRPVFDRTERPERDRALDAPSRKDPGVLDGCDFLD